VNAGYSSFQPLSMLGLTEFALIEDLANGEFNWIGFALNARHEPIRMNSVEVIVLVSLIVACMFKVAHYELTPSLNGAETSESSKRPIGSRNWLKPRKDKPVRLTPLKTSFLRQIRPKNGFLRATG
jgi:hypothetical protein